MLGSPQVYRERDFSFCMYFNENNEPPHVHVERGGSAAKVWLDPIELDWNRGFNNNEMRWILRQLRDQHGLFMRKWNAIKDQIRQR